MEKRKWPWKRKSSESESSDTLSSHSERYSDEQEGMKESPSDNLQLLEITSKATISEDELKESVRCLTEKLSAALVNVSAKEDLVKQHAKVAEEAVAGWEKAENEVTSLKQQLEVALQQNLNLEVKTSHLEGALKECVRQLRQARDEQAKRISDALMEKTSEWGLIKSDLEKRILDLEAEKSASPDPNTLLVLEALERENFSLKEGLVSCCKELEVLTIERDLSTQAAETASKLQLECIKKAAKLEAECRRLQSIAQKPNGPEMGRLSSRAPALTDQVKNLAVKIDMMDDFLEMERLAALPESDSVSVGNPLKDEADSMVQRVAELENMLEQIEAEKVELQDALEKANSKTEEVEIRLEEVQKELTAVNEAKQLFEFQLTSMEGESRTISANVNSLNVEIETERQFSAELRVKCQELENERTRAIQELRDALKKADSKTEEVETTLDEVQKELTAVREAKQLLEFQLTSMEEESRTISANVDSLNAEIESERRLSEELRVKCEELENELIRAIQESELQQSLNSNGELKIKQEDLAVAADKLSECQKTIASLGRQLQSLATLEDFLIDTSNIPGHSRDSLDSGEIWRLSSNETFVTNSDSRTSMEGHSYIPNGYRNEDSLRSSSSMPPSSTINGTYAKGRNSFGKFFC